MRTGLIAAGVAATVAVVAAYGQPRPYRLPHTPIDAARLSHDARALGSGDRADYLIRRFKALGLKPGGPGGGWTQAVPLTRYTVEGPVVLAVTDGTGTQPLAPGRDAAATTLRPVDRVQIDKAPLVFLGRAVEAPAGRLPDLAGKVALVFADAQGKDRVIDAAARRGAVGVLLLRDPAAAGEDVRKATAGFGTQLAPEGARADAPLLQGWLSDEAAARLFREAGLDFGDAARRGGDSGFQPLPLPGVAFSADYRVRRDHVVLRNVLAKLPGAGASGEALIYSARWRPLEAQDADGGTGLAGLLELARVYAHTPPTRRTLVFAAFADDARGHFGAEAYTARPAYPLSATAADIDIVSLQTAGLARDMVLAQVDRSSLRDDLDRAAARQGRRVTLGETSRPADWIADAPGFARKGVPVLPVAETSGPSDLVKGGRAGGEAWMKAHAAAQSRGSPARRAQELDLRGAALDLRLLYDVGRDVANSSAWPSWTSGGRLAVRRDPTEAKGR